MSDFFTQRRSELETFLHHFLAQKKTLYHPTHYWADDVFARLDSYVVRGKLMRGLLVLLAAESFSDQEKILSLEAAAAIELFHSGVLIHDDIIDQDGLRRGSPSMHAQYQNYAETARFTAPRHSGESFAICVGDICLFLAHDVLNQTSVRAEQLSKLQSLFIHEIIQVGFAEMNDVRMAVTPDTLSREEVLKMYAYKTGRYSIYLPLALGALVAQPEPSFLPILEKLGETMGVLMQLKDDELGLFGSEAETGKPVVSDVREGKKTLYYLYAHELATIGQRQVLSQLYGKPDLNLSELEQVRTIIRESGSFTKVQLEMREFEKSSLELVKQLPISAAMRSTWEELLALQSSRKR